jgi:hypothetical protein
MSFAAALLAETMRTLSLHVHKTSTLMRALEQFAGLENVQIQVALHDRHSLEPQRAADTSECAQRRGFVGIWRSASSGEISVRQRLLSSCS